MQGPIYRLDDKQGGCTPMSQLLPLGTAGSRLPPWLPTDEKVALNGEAGICPNPPAKFWVLRSGEHLPEKAKT